MADVYFAILGVTITIFVLVGGWLLYSPVFRERPVDSTSTRSRSTGRPGRPAMDDRPGW